MTSQLIVGILALSGGAILLSFGMNATHPTERPVWFIIGGLGLVMVGLYMLIVTLLSRGRESR